MPRPVPSGRIPSSRSPRSRPPQHRGSHRRSRRKPLGWKLRLSLAASVACVALLVWAIVDRSLAPASNTSRTRFDAIIVLGSQADSDGNPKPDQLSRVTEAVHEYMRGAAPRLILSGGAAHNRFVEARVMDRTAQAQGIPESAIFLEPQARNTMENACYSARIMKAHGWSSAEVVGAAAQMPRANLIFDALAHNSPPFQWSTHGAPPLVPVSAAYEQAVNAVEVLKTARYLIWARWADRCEP